jgi:hypothetical protein
MTLLTTRSEKRTATMTSNQREYFSSAELADRWRLSLQTLANWRHAGKGPPFVRVASRILYPAQAVYSLERLDTKWLSPHNSQETSAETQS